MSDFDGAHLVPRGISKLSSRSDVSLVSELLGLYPIMSSPMIGVSGVDLVVGMANNECLGIYHRFDTYENRFQDILSIRASTHLPFGVAIGIERPYNEIKVAQYAVSKGATLICVDIANGYLSKLHEYGKTLREMFPNTFLMSGNVVTLEGANALREAGFDFVRIGIGGGSHCTTRSVTGVGRNQMRALDACSSSDAYLVSDGGIRNSGDAVKSFASGADFVMLGGILAYAHEANNNGRLYGMASERNHFNGNKEVKSIEGRESEIDPKLKKPLKDILTDFMWGIKSGCTYLNASSYRDIRGNCTVEEY